MYDDVIERLRAVRREASLNADEVAAIDRAIEKIEHLTGLSAEYLEAVHREQKRYVQDTDVLFLARKDAERERSTLRDAVEGLRGQIDTFERNGPVAMPVFITRSRRILARVSQPSEPEPSIPTPDDT